MKRYTRLLLAFIASFLWVSPLWAHPHIFIDYQMELVLSQGKMQGIKMDWHLDLMNSQLILEEFDSNHDRRVTGQEALAIAENMRDNLKSFEYFTQVLVNGHRIPIRTVKNIQVTYHNKQIVYRLYLPCPIPVTPEAKQLTITPLDNTNYVAFSPLKPYPIKMSASPGISLKVVAPPKKMYDSTRFIMVKK